MFRSIAKAFLAGLLFCACIAGCASRRSRIDEKISLFSTYSPEIQMKIQNGDIEKGFTEDMVYMAKGDPEFKSQIQKKGKQTALWKYPLPYGAQGGESANSSLAGGYSYPGYGMGSPGSSTGAANGATMRRAYFIVEFENGKVTEWTQTK